MAMPLTAIQVRLPVLVVPGTIKAMPLPSEAVLATRAIRPPNEEGPSIQATRPPNEERPSIPATLALNEVAVATKATRQCAGRVATRNLFPIP